MKVLLVPLRCVMRISLIAGLIVTWVGASVAQSSGRVMLGEAVRVGDGYGRSYVTMDSAGKPISIGIIMTDSVLSGLPDAEMFYEYVLPMPAGVSVPPFTHVVVDWNPHGHEPPGVYNVPHFDYHFYMITPQEREGITATGEDLARVERKPPAQYVPQGYMWTPGGVPHMGAHWVPMNAPELHGGTFGETLIYGFYNGQMAFIEPMVTVAYLRTNPSLYAVVPQPARYPRPGYYPTSYAVVHDARMGRYVIALQGFAYRR